MAKKTQQNSHPLVSVSPTLELPEDVMPLLESSRSLEEIDDADKMVPWYFFNNKLKGPDDAWLASDVFFHSLREDTTETIEATLLFLRKTHRYRLYTEGEGSKTLCASLDRVEGLWRETGEVLSCADCRYAPLPQNWTNGTPPPCQLIWTLVGFDEANQEPFAINAKATSLTPAKRFLNQHFLRKFKGKDLPLFVYRVRIGLTQPTGTYAVLSFEVIEPNNAEAIRGYARLAEDLQGSSRISYETEPPEEG